jgi:hypothetical protein
VLNLTRKAIEEFDNSHDFERMAADILNSLGYENVEPMAPAGGADAGRDIKYTDAGARAVAFVTLEKQIKAKFARDVARVSPGELAALSLFCNVQVTPDQKLEFVQTASAKGATLAIYDLERLRSLLETSLKDIRRRYLHLDDAVSEEIRSKVSTLLRFPDAEPLQTSTMSLLETMLVDQRPAKLFAIVKGHNPETLSSVPEIGTALADIQQSYYAFKGNANELFNTLMDRVGRNVGVRFSQGWRIYVQYAFMRWGGRTREDIESGGNFLNYSITWDDAERVATLLQTDNELIAQLQKFGAEHEALLRRVEELRTALSRA